MQVRQHDHDERAEVAESIDEADSLLCKSGEQIGYIDLVLPSLGS